MSINKQEEQWQGKWICHPLFADLKPTDVLQKTSTYEHDPKLKNFHMLARKKFCISNKAAKYYLDITADDYYKLYINEKFVGQGPASSVNYHYYYNRYDVSDLLSEGENVIAVHVYYQGLINRVWNSGDLRQGMIAQLFADDKLVLATDETWKCAKALEFIGDKTFGYDTQFVEDIDSRLKIVDWRKTDYDHESWDDVNVKHDDDHLLTMQISKNLEVYEAKPKCVKKVEEGHFILDFGNELTGQFKMEARGEKGQEIAIMYGEEMEGEHVRYKMRCNCYYKDRWILSGDDDILEQYDYKAFRYVEVYAPPETVNIQSFCAVVRHYPFDEGASNFNSSNQILNGIWNICKNGVKYGAQEVYVDCPSREKGQYLGDMTITAMSHIYLTGDLRLFKKALKDFALSANICPGILAVAPGSFKQEIADFSLQYPLQILNYYKHSGDIEFLRELYPVAANIIDYFKKFQRDDGLIENVNEKWNLVDWPKEARDDYDFDLSERVGDGCHNVINGFFYGAIKVLNEIREVLQIDYHDELPSLKEAFINAFYDKAQNLFTDSITSSHTALHSNVLPLFYDIFPSEAKESIVNLIRDKRLSCSVYFAYFLLKGLGSISEHELLYQLMTEDRKWSWSNMLKEGGTTCFEAWGKELKWNTSLCHPWASAPISILIEDIIGIKPLKPGWKGIALKPHIPKALNFIDTEFQTPRGKIRFKAKNGNYEISI